jgi:hypothetical protein
LTGGHVDPSSPQWKALAAELREQLRARPYLVLAGVVGAGLVIGRRVPLRALVALGALGVRAAAASALQGALRGAVRPR